MLAVVCGCSNERKSASTFADLANIRKQPQTVLIAGGGLAGTALGWELHERGAPFVIVDPDEKETCSKVAAGLVTPITGKRVKPSWRVDELLPVALERYRKVEKLLGGGLYHERPLVRLFREPREVEWWRGRAGDPGLDRWVDPDAVAVDPAQFHSEFGGFVQRQSGWLDTAAYLEASRAFFERQGCLAAGRGCRGGSRTGRAGSSLARRKFQSRRLLPRCGTAVRLALFFVAQV